MGDTTEPDPWDEYADGWDDDPAARTYAEAAFASLVETLARFGRTLDGLTVCDFGCGTGLLTERLADTAARIDAVDTSPAMLARLATKAETHGWDHVRLSTEVPESVRGHDLVVCSSVLSFVDDLQATTTRLAELLGDGGVFVQWDWEADPADDEPHGLTREAIRTALEGAGLVDVRVDTAFELPFEDMVMRPLIGVGRVVDRR
ncbi:MAG: class I SAM-dependent methyltransferase [Actinomycetota bacterium]